MNGLKKIIKEHWMEIIVVVILFLTLIISANSQDDIKGAWFWTLLNNINIIVGFITAIIAYLTWRTTRILRGNYEKETRIAQSGDSLHAVAISISCERTLITENVKDFLKKNDEGKPIYHKLITGDQLKGSVELSQKYTGENSNRVRLDVMGHFISLKLADMPYQEGELGNFMKDYSTALEDICGLCKANNISNIYLFVAAPMPIVFLAGEKFANKFLVYTHQLAPDKSKYVMTTHRSFSDYVDRDKLFDFSEV